MEQEEVEEEAVEEVETEPLRAPVIAEVSEEAKEEELVLRFFPAQVGSSESEEGATIGRGLIMLDPNAETGAAPPADVHPAFRGLLPRSVFHR